MDEITKKLLDACESVLFHVEDMRGTKRVGSECTLCHTYRKMLRDAREAAYAAHPELIKVEDLPF